LGFSFYQIMNFPLSPLSPFFFFSLPLPSQLSFFPSSSPLETSYFSGMGWSSDCLFAFFLAPALPAPLDASMRRWSLFFLFPSDILARFFFIA